MKYFYTKIYIAMFVGLSATALHSADNNLSQVLLDVNSATKTATTLPFSQCVLDFTDANTSLTSAATLGMHLVADNATGTLGLTDASYCIMEILAATIRKTPGSFGNLPKYFTDVNAVYTAFGEIANTTQTAERDLSVLGDINTCTSFVKSTATIDLPKLLSKLGAPPAVTTEVSLLLPVAIPVAAQLLNKSYLGMVSAAKALQKLEDEVVSGCFKWFPCCNK